MTASHRFRLLAGLALLLLIVLPSAAQEAGPMGAFFRSVDGTQIYYDVRGDGPPVVLVHGFINTSDTWKRTPLYEDLVDVGFTVITLDLRGNGRSDHPHTLAAYEDDAEAKDIMALVDTLSLSSYCAVGYSRGSIITARLLMLDERLRCAVLGGMGADFTDPDWPRRQMAYDALAGKPVPEMEGMLRYIEQISADREALKLQQQAQPSTSPEELAQVEIPVLVISGDDDHENGSAAELAALIPTATHAEVPGDHNGTKDTAAFSSTVVGFLKQHTVR